LCFNSRPRAAGDADLEALLPLVLAVSIHARARRATLEKEADEFAEAFQFTPARGGRLTLAAMGEKVLEFQFTPARGGRLPAAAIIIDRLLFQFTPARGGRQYPPCSFPGN